MKSPFYQSVALALFSLFGLSTLATEPVKPVAKKTVRLLTIGNSFSQDATNYLDELAAADGNLLILKTAVIGGSPLQLHWDKAQLHEKDPADKNGQYSTGRGLKEILSDGPHDFVTIQQRSISSHDVATYRPYAAKRSATYSLSPVLAVLRGSTGRGWGEGGARGRSAD